METVRDGVKKALDDHFRLCREKGPRPRLPLAEGAEIDGRHPLQVIAGVLTDNRDDTPVGEIKKTAVRLSKLEMASYPCTSHGTEKPARVATVATEKREFVRLRHSFTGDIHITCAMR